MKRKSLVIAFAAASIVVLAIAASGMGTEPILKLALGCVVLIWIALVDGALWLVVQAVHAGIDRARLSAVPPRPLGRDATVARALIVHTFLAIASTAIVLTMIFLLIDFVFQDMKEFARAL